MIIKRASGMGTVSSGDHVLFTDVPYHLVVEGDEAPIDRGRRDLPGPNRTTGRLVLDGVRGPELMAKQSARPFSLTLGDGRRFDFVLRRSSGEIVMRGGDL
jgi:hypothetical protein